MMIPIPINDKDKSMPQRLDDVYTYLAELCDIQNKRAGMTHDNVIYAGNVAFGTVPAPDEVKSGHIFTAVIGDIPILAVRYGNMICGRGGDTGTAAALNLTVTGREMDFNASDILNKLILLL